jgi:tetratricopeptide (TPR) repeat protein
MAQVGGRSNYPSQIAVWARNHLGLWIPVTTALITLVTVLISLPGQSPKMARSLLPLFVILLALSVVLPLLGERSKRRDEKIAKLAEEEAERVRQEHARRERVDRLLQSGSATRLPRLSKLTDVDLGATQTRYSIENSSPYVPRGEADEKVRRLLADSGPPYPFVLLWGTTKAGKSRTLAEALRTVFPGDTVVIMPNDERALAELARLGIEDFIDRRPALVVLDDVDPSGLEYLTSQVLDTVREWAVIAATMTSQRRADVLKSGSQRIARIALAQTSGQVELTSEPPTGAQKVEAERLYPLEHFDGSIAETLVGATELISRYRASQDGNPAGCAIVRALVDARRGGIARPITDTELRQLFPEYLHGVRVNLQPTPEQYAAGIQWATQPVASQVALLRRANPTKVPPEWIIFDHVVTADQGGSGDAPREFPHETWTLLTRTFSADDALGVGLAASAQGQEEAAVEALRRAITSSDTAAAAAAALGLGQLLEKQDDLQGALALYEQAMGSGHPDAAPAGAWGVATLLRKQGSAKQKSGDVEGQQRDWKAARAAYQRAIDSGHPDFAPEAEFGLGLLLEEQGDDVGARDAYRRSIDTRRPVTAQVAAMLQLGRVLERLDDMPGARDAYQFVIDHDAQLAPTAAAYLGNLLEEHGDLKGACVAYRRAIESGQPDHAPGSAYRLAGLLKNEGDIDGARTAYQIAVDSDGFFAPFAAVALGVMLRDHGDPEGAQAAFYRALENPERNPQSAHTAAVFLSDLLMKQGDKPAANEAYKLARLLQEILDAGDESAI